jgi:hypothetical protein
MAAPSACVATRKLYPSRTKSSVIGSRDYRHVLPNGFLSSKRVYLDYSRRQFGAFFKELDSDYSAVIESWSRSHPFKQRQGPGPHSANNLPACLDQDWFDG